jgi:hypothetical protein
MLDYFTSFIKQRVCQELYGKKKNRLIKLYNGRNFLNFN